MSKNVNIHDLVTNYTMDVPYLTTTRSKMYGLYIVHPTRVVEEVSFDNEMLFDGWRDHCIEPAVFYALSHSLNCEFDNETFARICMEFVENYLNSDWTKLHNFLPKETNA